MIPKYKIIEVFPERNQVVVRFYSDTVSEEMLGGVGPNGEFARGMSDMAITLPYPTPTGADLDGVIRAYFPQMQDLLQHVEDTQVTKVAQNTLADIPLNTEVVIDPSVVVKIWDGKPVELPPVQVPPVQVPAIDAPAPVDVSTLSFL